MATIFNINKSPILFHIPTQDPVRDAYLKLIVQHGGYVVENSPRPDNSIILISSRPHGPKSYDIKLITDSISNGRLVSIIPYLHPPVSEVGPSDDDDEPSRKRAKLEKRNSVKYTDAQDQHILEQIRMNPQARGSQVFYEELSKHKQLIPHPPNSIRSRYRNFLVDKLDFIYKTDNDNNLITDDHGNYIKVGLEHLPNKKTKYTAQDDYLLCTKILEWAKEKAFDGMEISFNDPKPPVSFFSSTMLPFKQHTGSSWRDRYRKFTSKYGVENYINYYEQTLKNGEIPVEMKNMTKRSDRRNVKDIQNLAHDLKASIGSMANIQRPNLDEVDDDIEDEESQPKDTAEDNSVSEKVSSTDIKKIESKDNKGPFASADAKVPANDLKHKKPALFSPHLSVEESQIDSQLISDSQLDEGIKYLAKHTTTNDVIDGEIMFKHSSDELIEEIDKVCNIPDKSIPQLFNDFKNLGIKAPLTSHILMCTNLDLTRVKLFNKIWIEKVNLEGGDLLNDPYKLFNIYNHTGIWNPDYDNLLKSESKILENVHGEEEINLRIEFLQTFVN